MVRFKTFKKALGKIESINIQKIPETNGLVAKRACFDKNTKQYKFFDKNGNEIVKFHQYDVRIISRISIDDNADKFVFMICLKNDIDYRMEFFMRGKYSFFAADTYTRRNVQAVLEAAPKHLKDFDKKKIKVKRFSLNEIFTTLGDDDNEENIMTDCYVINALRFSVFTLSGVVVIGISDDNFNGGMKGMSRILNVQFIVDNAGSVIIGTPDSEYVLTAVD